MQQWHVVEALGLRGVDSHDAGVSACFEHHGDIVDLNTVIVQHVSGDDRSGDDDIDGPAGNIVRVGRDIVEFRLVLDAE